MTDFRLSCIRLLATRPLYDYVSTDAGGERKLNVLLLGSGRRLDVLLREVLTAGQMLDTALDVTVVNGNIASSMDSFLKKVPALGDFVQIIREYTPITTPQDPLCTLRFESGSLSPEGVPDLLLARSECRYIIISTGNDQRNQALADACAAYQADESTVVAFVREGTDEDTPSAVQVLSSGILSQAFGPDTTDKDYLARLEPVAYHIFRTYCKGQDPHMRRGKIQEDFKRERNYLTSLAAAVHVHTKLACCGIRERDPLRAARAFQAALAGDPVLLDRLSAMEHRRWMMETLLAGYSPMPDLERIFSGPGITTHDPEAKWHCYLVPCDPTGESRLIHADWDKTPKARMSTLDELDRTSLKVYRLCAQIAQDRRPQIDQLLATLAEALSLDMGYSLETLECQRRLEAAVTQLWQGQRSAMALYRKERDALKAAIAWEGGSRAFMLTSTLDLLDLSLAPLLEHLQRRDHKEWDRLLIRQIPFALTHREGGAVCKVLSQREWENLYSVWQMEPQRGVFLAAAVDDSEWGRVQDQGEYVRRFLARDGQETQLEFHVLVPESAFESLAPAQGWTMHPVARWSVEGLRGELEALGLLTGEDLLDVTGGDPLLTRAAEAAAQNAGAGVFYTRAGRFYDLFGAETVEYVAPVKTLTVGELFHLSGAVLEETEGDKNLDLSGKYKQLWAIAAKDPLWDNFCKTVAAAYRDSQPGSFAFETPVTQENECQQSLNVPSLAAEALMPALRKLETLGYLRDIRAQRELGEQVRLSYTLPENTANAQALYRFLQRVCGAPHPTVFFTLSRLNRAPNLSCCDLCVKDLDFPAEVSGGCGAILGRLEREGFILNHRQDANGRHSFQLASREVLACIQKSGTILEYVIYYSALAEGEFDDVQMGWKFAHSSDSNSAENEIDVVCTQGAASLFISAKMCSAAQFSRNDQMNFILYEISYLTQRFGGGNAKAVLVAPNLPQFEVDEETRKLEHSGAVRSALRRGVYLLGRECVEKNGLGEALSRIMENRSDWCDFLR